MRSIKSRLILCFSILILLSSAILGFTLLYRVSGIVKQESEKALYSIAVEVSKLTESRIEIQKRVLEMIAYRPDIRSMNWEIQQPILKEELSRSRFLDIGVVQLDGTTHYTDGSTSQLGDRDYVKRALNGEANISDVIISRVTNQPVIMYAHPIVKDGKIVGALIGRRDGNTLSSITDDAGYGESGYAYILNNKGTVVAHPDRDKVINQFNPIEEAKEDKSLEPVAQLFQKMLENKSGVSDYEYQGDNLYAGYEPIPGTGWTLVITTNEAEVLSAIPTLQKMILTISFIILFISVGLIYFVGHSIAKPIVDAINHSKKIANLNIAEDVPAKLLDKKDEIGALAKSLQKITESLREIIREISSSSEQVAAASEELTAISQQSANAAEAVSRTVEEIAKSASSQARNTEDGATKAILLGETIEKDQEYVKNLNTATNSIVGVVQEGLKEIENLSVKTGESNNALKEIYDIIIKTNDSSKKIGQASNVIASIAEQTNLLALNAAIEAARAGEAGRGFAVVAEEIRKLAEQSSSSTKAIDGIIVELHNNVGSVVKTMERVSSISKQQTSGVEQSKEKFMAIAQAVESAEQAVKQLNTSGEEMEKMKNEILDVLQNLSAIAEENAAATEEATASMEEQTASMEEIASSSEGLSTLAQNLQSVMMKFKI